MVMSSNLPSKEFVMSTRWLALAAILLVPFLLWGETGVPTDSQIHKWWRPGNGGTPGEKFEVSGTLHGIMLTGKEEALLVAVHFPQRGRNSMDGVLLVRPRPKEAREMEGVKDFEVFSNRESPNEPSLISAEGSASGGGTMYGEKQALYFDGWNPVVLHKRAFGDNSGVCTPDRACFAQETEWVFTDLNGDKRVDLVEVVIQKYGSSEKTRWVTRSNTFLRKGNKLLPSPPTMKMAPNLLK
jgi:hypothetical protein